MHSRNLFLVLDEFARIRLEAFLAARRTEIVSVTFKFNPPRGVFARDAHSADRIDDIRGRRWSNVFTKVLLIGWCFLCVFHGLPSLNRESAFLAIAGSKD
jgi:hypothetical protein